MGYKRQARRSPRVIFNRGMERQATQPAAVPSGRKRRRVSSKKQKLEEEAQVQALDMKATQPPTRELVVALNALPRADPPPAHALDMKATRELEMAQIGLPRAADPPPPPPTVSPVQSVNELMEGTLKNYEEECVEEGTFQSDPATEVQDLDQMETQLNHLLYETCPFHPHQFIHCVNPQTQVGPLRFKCLQEGCPVYLFEDTREVMMETLKEDTHPQVRARLQQGELRCQCGFVPKMKLSRTSKNYNKVFFSCGSFLTHAKPCGYFQWLHGPLWRPREQAQPTLRRWVKDMPPWSEYLPVPLLKGKGQEKEESPPWEMNFVERNRSWFNQFGEAAKAKDRERERSRHLHNNLGST